MQRFFLAPGSFHENSIQISDQSVLHQMKRVLRLSAGEKLIFLDNTGLEYEAALEILNEKYAEAKILAKRKNTAEPEIFLTLYQALPKKRELFELVLQKGTEIGVNAFVPLTSERTERLEIGNPERLQRILKEAAEQCGRGKIPALMPSVNFEQMLRDKKSAEKILLHTDGTISLSRCETAKQSSAALAVGPEGGFSEKEVEAARSAGWQISSLGPRVLRTETTGIAGSALLLL